MLEPGDDEGKGVREAGSILPVVDHFYVVLAADFITFVRASEGGGSLHAAVAIAGEFLTGSPRDAHGELGSELRDGDMPAGWILLPGGRARPDLVRAVGQRLDLHDLMSAVPVQDRGPDCPHAGPRAARASGAAPGKRA